MDCERRQHDCGEFDKGAGKVSEGSPGESDAAFVLPKRCGQCPDLPLLYWMAEAALYF
jgi:hypothetical protein